MSVELYRESPGKFASRTPSRETLSRWTGCIHIYIYIYIHTHTYVYIYIYIHRCIRIHICFIVYKGMLYYSILGTYFMFLYIHICFSYFIVLLLFLCLVLVSVLLWLLVLVLALVVVVVVVVAFGELRQGRVGLGE